MKLIKIEQILYKIAFKLKNIFIGTPLHKPLDYLRALIIKLRVALSQDSPSPTIYILSPYKTGTTYIDSLWEDDLSKHEPFHLYSLKYLTEDFEKDFKKRANALDLKMECSGFLSLYLNKLPKVKRENGLKYIYILRPPHKWVASVINFFPVLIDTPKEYIDRYYWSKLLNYSMYNILKCGKADKLEKLVRDLYKVYFKLLKDAYHNPDIEFVELSNIDSLVTKLEKEFNKKANYDKSRQRKTKNNFDEIKMANPRMEEKYEIFLRKLPDERKVL